MPYEYLKPGDEIEIDGNRDRNGKIVADAVWQANIHRYQRYAACLAGADSMLRPPEGSRHPVSGDSLRDRSYLRRLPGESSGDISRGDVFRARRDCAAHDPISLRIVWTYVDTLFRQSADRSSPETVLGQEFMRSVDMRGTHAEDWLASFYAQGLGHGWAIGLVDTPETSGDYPSVAHQEAAGRLPYLQVILPPRVWGLKRDQFGNIIWALIHESETTWREWTPTGTVVYNSDGEVVVGFQEHGFGRIPMEMFVARDPRDDDPTAPPGESAIQEISLIEIQILQHLSLLDDVQRKTGFPFLWVRKDQHMSDGIAEDQTLGADFMFLVDAECQWLAPPKECSEQGKEYVEWLEGLAYKVGGVHRRSMESVEAHSGLALDWENAPIYATVQRWARRLRDFELRLWRLCAEVMGKDGAQIDVTYPDDFSTRPIDQDISQATSLVGIYGGYGSAPEWVQVGVNAMVRRALTRTVGHVKEVQKGLAVALLPPVKEEPQPDVVVVDQEIKDDAEDNDPGGNPFGG